MALDNLVVTPLQPALQVSTPGDTVSNGTVVFGPGTAGSTSTMVVLTNNGAVPLHGSGLILSGSGFTLGGTDTGPFILYPGQSTDIPVSVVDPTQPAAGSLEISSDDLTQPMYSLALQYYGTSTTPPNHPPVLAPIPDQSVGPGGHGDSHRLGDRPGFWSDPHLQPRPRRPGRGGHQPRQRRVHLAGAGRGVARGLPRDRSRHRQRQSAIERHADVRDRRAAAHQPRGRPGEWHLPDQHRLRGHAHRGRGAAGRRAVTLAVTAGGHTIPLGIVTTDASGVASLSGVSLPAFPAGSYPSAVIASFGGDTGDAPTIGSGGLTIAQATPTITWATPADITQGQALGAAQLDATASVPGTFAYTTAAGTVLPAGMGQSLTAVFTPADTTDYTSVNAGTTLDVLPGPPRRWHSAPATLRRSSACR